MGRISKGKRLASVLRGVSRVLEDARHDLTSWRSTTRPLTTFDGFTTTNNPFGDFSHSETLRLNSLLFLLYSRYSINVPCSAEYLGQFAVLSPYNSRSVQ
jgi:hypothetical protein